MAEGTIYNLRAEIPTTWTVNVNNNVFILIYVVYTDHKDSLLKYRV